MMAHCISYKATKLCFNNRILGENLAPVKSFKHTEAYAAVRSRAAFVLLIHCLLLLPLFVGVLCLVFVFVCSTLCPS